MELDRGGVMLHCSDEGRGPAVALLHGHSLDLRVFDDLAGRLQSAGFRAVRWDQRGHGRSGCPPRGYGWGDHAADAAAVLHHLSAGPAHLVGLSKGGGIALEVALRYPELVRSLVLVAPLLPDWPLSPEMVASFRELARAIRSEGAPAALRRVWLGHPLIEPAVACAAARPLLESMIECFPAGEYLTSERDAADRDWRVPDRLGEVAVPTMVVSGSAEVEDFAAMARAITEGISGARLEIVEGAGHLVPLIAPDETARLVLGFLLAAERGT